jgi:hypothetical protein
MFRSYLLHVVLIVENALTVDREDDLQVTTNSIHDKVSDLGNCLFDTKK